MELTDEETFRKKYEELTKRTTKNWEKLSWEANYKIYHAIDDYLFSPKMKERKIIKYYGKEYAMPNVGDIVWLVKSSNEYEHIGMVIEIKSITKLTKRYKFAELTSRESDPDIVAHDNISIPDKLRCFALVLPQGKNGIYSWIFIDE